MGRLVGEDFADIVRKVPDQDYDVQKVMEIYQEYLPLIAEDYGLVYVKANITRPGSELITMRETQMMDMYNSEQAQEANEKHYYYEMGNGGHVDIQVGIRNGFLWSAEQEQDMDVLMKTNYLFMGRAQAMHDLARAMLVDPITDMANQAGAYKYMGDLMSKGTYWNQTAFFLNIRNMKLFNDRYRETGGNILLRRYAKALKKFVGEESLVCRLGGDNFLVLMERGREQGFLDFLSDLRVELAGRSGIPSQIKMDTRVGYYEVQPGDSIQEVMGSASIALRYAKGNFHPDVVKFEPKLKVQMFQLKSLDEDTPGALEREEFAVYYQPKARMTEEGAFILCGAEALVRWFKDGSIIMPSDFIPFMEKNGMVSQLDFYMLEHVCRDIRSWLEKGLTPVPVSVNFSRRHLKYDDIADRIGAVLKKYEVDPSYVEIEITESYEDEDMDVLSGFEKKMHEQGLRVLMDDFGSGFSSLKMLKYIVTDTIKLDKSLIDGIGGENSREDEIIISHIISMIRELGKEVIAEGVESVEQARFLYENGCDMIQGFLYGKPMSWEVFEKKLAEQKKN